MLQSYDFAISVIIPSYKPGEYIEKCIESVCNQTLDKNCYEVIVVLNGCNEPYRSRLNEMLNGYSNNIQLIQTDTPGVSNARNMGLDRARGEYIVFIDDDDWVSPNYFDTLLKHAEEGIVVQSNEVKINEETLEVMPYFVTKAYEQCRDMSPLSLVKGRRFLSQACCKLIPCSIIDGRRFNTDYALGEDSLFMFAISNKIKQVKLTGEDCVYYVRCNALSATRKGHSRWFKIKLAARTVLTYTGIVLSGRGYSLSLYATRIAGVLYRNLIQRWD